MRFEDTVELFGKGVGLSTCGDIECGICKTFYNKGNDATESWEGDSVGLIEFAGLTVCECCFEKIENEVLYRMSDILSWFHRVQDARRKEFKEAKDKLEAVERKKWWSWWTGKQV